jgi:3-hydroxyisobutyrate dehydrogenase-like beta-hydroxyacid dehydrogenase
LKIGFVGLGTMGAPMAINLLKAGFGLKVFDIEPGSDRVKRVVEHGAKLTEKPRDVAKGSEFILLSLPNASASEQAMLGEEGILQATSPGSVVIELSTVSPSTVRKIANSAEPLGIDILDAPVSGGKSGAESATLTIMVGGKREVFDRSMNIFKSIGKNIFYVGGLGSGEVVKLLNNMLVLIDLVTAQSVLEIAVKAGVDLRLLHSIINASTGQSWNWTNWIPKILDRQNVGSTPDIFNKDMTEALKMAEELKISPETAKAALKIVRSYVEKNQGKLDMSAMFDFLPGRVHINK